MRKLDTTAPAPSAELILIAVFVQAHVGSLPRKQAERFLREARERLNQYCELAEVPRLRASQQDAELAEAIRQAHAWYRASLPLLMASIGR